MTTSSFFMASTECENLVGCFAELRKFAHGASLCLVDHALDLKSAGVHAAAAQPYLGAFGKHRLEHALNVEITLRGLLSLNGVEDTVPKEEYAHACVLFFLQGHREPQRVVGFLIPVWGVIDDEEIIHGIILSLYCHYNNHGLQWRNIRLLRLFVFRYARGQFSVV